MKVGNIVTTNTIPISIDMSIKNPSGSILISKSVFGSNKYKSLSKNSLWKISKYFVKFVEIISDNRATNIIINRLPTWNDFASTYFQFSFKIRGKPRATIKQIIE